MYEIYQRYYIMLHQHYSILTLYYINVSVYCSMIQFSEEESTLHAVIL